VTNDPTGMTLEEAQTAGLIDPPSDESTLPNEAKPVESMQKDPTGMSLQEAQAAGLLDNQPTSKPRTQDPTGMTLEQAQAAGLLDTPHAPPAEGKLATGVREFGHSIIPTGGAIAGMGVGAGAGMVVGGPPGAIVGGVAGALVGAYGGAQVDALTSKVLGIDDEAQRVANRTENPGSALVGELATIPLSFGTGIGAVAPKVRAIGAAAMGGLQGVQEYVETGKVDVGNIATAAGMGAAFPTPRRLTSKIMEPAGELGAKLGAKLMGRTDAEVATASRPTNSGDYAATDAAPTPKREAGADPGSVREYEKVPKSQGTLSTDEIDPTIRAAVPEAETQKPVEPATQEPTEIPQAPVGGANHDIQPDVPRQGPEKGPVPAAGFEESENPAPPVEAQKAIQVSKGKAATEAPIPKDVPGIADEQMGQGQPGDGSALRRKVLERDKSGRPTKTERLPPGEGQPIIDEITKRNADSQEPQGPRTDPTLDRRWTARQPKTYAEADAANMSDELVQQKNMESVRSNELTKKVEAFPKEFTFPKTLKRIFQAHERDDIQSLPPKEQTFYQEHILPILAQAHLDKAAIEKLAPGSVAPDVENHIMRLTEDFGSKKKNSREGKPGDPVEGVRDIYTGPQGPANERKFFALVNDKTGERTVISPTDDGYKSWKGYKDTDVVDPKFNYEEGKTYTRGANTYTMKGAYTDEIEANANFANGKPARYKQNIALSAVAAAKYLGDMRQNLEFVNSKKTDPVFLSHATLNPEEGAKRVGPDGKPYTTTIMPQFNHPGEVWHMDPRMAMVLDDFTKAGFKEGDPLSNARRLSQAITKLMFWMPIAHIANVGTHWFVSRGWDWLNPAAYERLATSGMRAIRAVIEQGHEVNRVLDAGGSMVFPGVRDANFIERTMDAVGEHITQNPAKWQQVADTLGVNPTELTKAIYSGSKTAMWSVNDMFYMQGVYEREMKGMKLKDAIVDLERSFPNYRMPTTIMGSGQWSRFLSKVLSDPTYMAFGRYHENMMNAQATIVKDLAVGTGKERMDAIGKLMALSILGFAIKPVLDKMATLVTGDPNASINARGPLSIPNHLYRWMMGKEDYSAAVRAVGTIPPLASTALDVIRGKNFAGKDIAPPADLTKPGNVGLAATQLGEHVASGLIAPLNTVETAARNKRSIPAAVGQAALDIKVPSRGSVKWEAKSPMTNAKNANTRAKNPPGIGEAGYNAIMRSLGR
jgi:hypothetical protein